MSTTRPIDLQQECEWIAGLQAGRLEVFQAVFEAYAHRLQHFAQLWVPRDTAEDLVQDLFFDMWQRRATLMIERTLSTYLFSAMRNQISKYLRHHNIVNRTQEALAAGELPGMSRGPALPDASVHADDLQAALAAGMATLSELQRAVLMLRWVQHMSFAQIAATLSISENAAKLHASRGRHALSQALGPLFEE